VDEFRGELLIFPARSWPRTEDGGLIEAGEFEFAAAVGVIDIDGALEAAGEDARLEDARRKKRGRESTKL